MKLHKLFIFTILATLFSACGEETTNVNDLFSVNLSEKKSSYVIEDVLTASIIDKKAKGIESISYSLDGENLATGNGNTVSISLANAKMGKRLLTATIVSDGKEFIQTKEFTVKASKAGQLYGYKILETYPHDIKAYTQGIEFYNDTLYESTGQYGTSSLRKTIHTTGEVLNNIPLENNYFGEGLTILNNKLYQLTWKEKTGFIYNLSSLDKTGTFVYNESKEGWGLCNDGEKIYKSDGTQKIWTLNANTLAEEEFIEIYTNKAKIDNVNELEWVEGKIYANIYQESAIAIVNPANGAVEGAINLKGLQKEVTQHSKLDVLNGIAYKGEPNILYVTGKNWDKMFKIEIVPN